MTSLKSFISKRREETDVIPQPNEIFNAFRACSFALLKVIIIADNPISDYTNTGIPFSSISRQTSLPLKNILDEIYEDVYFGNTGGVKVFNSNNLIEWARQGVLILSPYLTCEKDKPHAHRNKGWEIFIENTISFIEINHGCKLVYMLWGKGGQKFENKINKDRHLILKAGHPASAQHKTDWFGCKHFTKANNFIKKHYFNQRAPITWGLFNSHS